MNNLKTEISRIEGFLNEHGIRRDRAYIPGSSITSGYQPRDGEFVRMIADHPGQNIEPCGVWDADRRVVVHRTGESQVIDGCVAIVAQPLSFAPATFAQFCEIIRRTGGCRNVHVGVGSTPKGIEPQSRYLSFALGGRKPEGLLGRLWPATSFGQCPSPSFALTAENLSAVRRSGIELNDFGPFDVRDAVVPAEDCLPPENPVYVAWEIGVSLSLRLS